MTQQCPIEKLDTRYEGLRLKDMRREKELLSSIMEEGIQSPLLVISQSESNRKILLDGYKRQRCANRLNLAEVPVFILGENIPTSLVRFLKLNSSSGLAALEEASFIDELHSKYGLSVSEMAHRLGKSTAWVSIRLGLLSRLSRKAKTQIFAGRFPVRSYMYSLRKFTRVNKTEVDNFIQSVSGKNLSVRDIDLLAQGYFKGPPMLKAQIRQGNLDWTLHQLKTQPKAQPGSAEEGEQKVFMRNISIIIACMGKVQNVLYGSQTDFLFASRVRKMVKRLLNQLNNAKTELEGFYVRHRQAPGGANTLQGREIKEADSQSA